MNHRNLLLNSTIILVSVGTLFASQANGQENLTFAGRVVTGNSAQQSNPQFSLKLYPPLKSGKAVLLSNTDYKGNFKFKGLSASSYLLEIYLVKDLVYQEVIELNKNLVKDIDLSKASASSKPSAPRPSPSPGKRPRSRRIHKP